MTARRPDVAVTLEGLPLTDREAALALGCFAPDAVIPPELARLLWAPRPAPPVDTLLGSGLVTADDDGRLRVDPGVRTALRELAGAATMTSTSSGFLGHVIGQLDIPVSTPIPFWDLPDDAAYLWNHLIYHLVEARWVEELTDLLADPRWVLARIGRVGGAAAAADYELAGFPLVAAELRWLASTVDKERPSGREGWIREALRKMPVPAPRHRPVVPAAEAPVTAPPAPATELRLGLRWHRPPAAAVAPTHVIETGAALAGVRIAADGSWLVAFGEDGGAWETGTGETSTWQRRFAFGEPVRDCAIAPGGDFLVTLDAGEDAQIRDPATGAVRHRLVHQDAGDDGSARRVLSIAATADAAVTGHEQAVVLWDPATGEPRAEVPVPPWVPPQVIACAPLPSGEILYIMEDGLAFAYDPATGDIEEDPGTGSVGGTVYLAVPSDGGGFLLLGMRSDRVAVDWVAAPAEIELAAGWETPAPLTGVAVDAAGRIAVCTHEDGSVEARDLRDGDARVTGFVRSAALPTGCAIAPDGSWFAVADAAGAVRVHAAAALRCGDRRVSGRQLREVTATTVTTVEGGVLDLGTGEPVPADGAAGTGAADSGTGRPKLYVGHESDELLVAGRPVGRSTHTTLRTGTGRLRLPGDFREAVWTPDGSGVVAVGPSGVVMVDAEAPRHCDMDV